MTVVAAEVVEDDGNVVTVRLLPFLNKILYLIQLISR
jgi:hypothetical protein